MELDPEKILLPSGSNCQDFLFFTLGSRTVLAARITGTFWAGVKPQGSMQKQNAPALVHLLSPGFNGTTVTRDWKISGIKATIESKRRN